ncbi:MAG: GNAT family N-acetyltransferase [Gammaproteobacteria bacterium]|nr:GNAT family N-acetyltransferase [Gammaproteobacteria bacterium]MYK47667.1 GNAT family N-acetyltransferase [Gammaproteobacteria bacterium]
MAIEIRQATADEMAEFGILGGYVYGGAFGDGPDNLIARVTRPEWTLCAFDDGKLATSFSTIPFTMRANGIAMPLAGVSTVGTQPEYRRQGLVRRIHTKALEHMRDAGQPVAALWASQAAIYQRYGYAMSTVLRSYAVDTVDIRFHDGDDGSGRVERVGLDDGYDTIKALYIEFIADRMCNIHRAKDLWLNNVLDTEEEDGPIWVAVCHGRDGHPRGYVVYTLRADKVDHPSRGQELRVRELVWLDQDAYRSLWSFIASHDLVGRVTWNAAPADDPAFEFFYEPRLLNARDHEGAWFRVVDAANALAGRGYDVTTDLAIGIEPDALTPWNDGVWRLETSTEGAHARPINETPDIRLNAKSLTSLFTGFRSATQLANWGLLDGDRDAVVRADAMFRTRHAPHCPDHF